MSRHFDPMQLPYFFEENIPSEGNLYLGEGTSKHVAQVLRMQQDQLVQLTNGRGELFTASIIEPNKNKTEVKILSKTLVPVPHRKISIAISPIKNNSRFEWFLEKATELGVAEIIPLLCDRTEKTYVKMERMLKIISSAMVQSRQCWLPEVRVPIQFCDFISQPFGGSKFIAHCANTNKSTLNEVVVSPVAALALIGPEGDFREHEIEEAIEKKFDPISLGETRLRTETAGIVASVLLINK